jgi:hypothetical protein
LRSIEELCIVGPGPLLDTDVEIVRSLAYSIFLPKLKSIVEKTRGCENTCIRWLGILPGVPTPKLTGLGRTDLARLEKRSSVTLGCGNVQWPAPLYPNDGKFGFGVNDVREVWTLPPCLPGVYTCVACIRV